MFWWVIRDSRETALYTHEISFKNVYNTLQKNHKRISSALYCKNILQGSTKAAGFQFYRAQVWCLLALFY